MIELNAELQTPIVSVSGSLLAFFGAPLAPGSDWPALLHFGESMVQGSARGDAQELPFKFNYEDMHSISLRPPPARAGSAAAVLEARFDPAKVGSVRIDVHIYI